MSATPTSKRSKGLVGYDIDKLFPRLEFCTLMLRNPSAAYGQGEHRGAVDKRRCLRLRCHRNQPWSETRDRAGSCEPLGDASTRKIDGVMEDFVKGWQAGAHVCHGTAKCGFVEWT